MKNKLLFLLKILGIAKYLLIPVVAHGQTGFTDCAKDQYVSFVDSVDGPVISGIKTVYHYYQIPWDKITQVNDSVYEIIHPDFSNSCKAVVLQFVDSNSIVAIAKNGDNYDIVVGAMYLNRVPKKIFIVPFFK